MRKGEVWVYYDNDSQKLRPAVVVGNKLLETDNDIVIAKLTSHEPRNEYDIKLEKWKEYGLRNESTVRCSKLFTLKEHELKFYVAQIDEEMMEVIKQTITKYILD